MAVGKLQARLGRQTDFVFLILQSFPPQDKFIKSIRFRTFLLLLQQKQNLPGVPLFLQLLLLYFPDFLGGGERFLVVARQ